MGGDSTRRWAYWDGPVEGYPPEHRDFARMWQKTQKIVFSQTLTGATTRNTYVERDIPGGRGFTRSDQRSNRRSVDEGSASSR